MAKNKKIEQKKVRKKGDLFSFEYIQFIFNNAMCLFSQEYIVTAPQTHSLVQERVIGGSVEELTVRLIFKNCSLTHAN